MAAIDPVAKAAAPIDPLAKAVAAIRRRATAGSVIAALAAGTVPADAQEPAALDQGRFEIRVAGRTVATELFAIRPQGRGRMAVGRITAVSPGGGTFEVGLEVDAELRPVRYELRPGDESLPSVVVTRGGVRLRLVTSGAEGERLREFLASDDLIIVERGVAHHHRLVADRVLASGGATPRRIGDALSPLDGERVPITLRSIRADTLRRDGTEPARARRIELAFGDEARILWVGPAGELLRVEIPAREWIAVRQPGR